MKRRKFVATAGLGAALSSCASASGIVGNSVQEIPRAFYEWRSYEMKWGASSKLFMSYLKDMLKPALIKAGASDFVVYKEIEGTSPSNVYIQISYPDIMAYQNSLAVSSSADFIASTKEYDSQDSVPYKRLSNSLLHAFEGLPQGQAPISGASIFEVRYYEGYNEDAVRRKIQMFNHEEIQLFLDLDLSPVFFGDMIVGPYMPCLVYMLNFRDMDHRKAAWTEFGGHPRWKEMVAKPEYANTVSNIRNMYLQIV